ncbi:MAG: hypothetical protein ACRER2_10615 [Methylococcales bacterium]
MAWFLQERPFVRPEHAGVLLYGELLNGKASLHIRENGTGGCRLTWLEETNEGKTVLVENKILRGIGRKNDGPTKLRYRVFWCHEQNYGYRQLAARFNGFEWEV